MIILGISDSHESHACIIRDGEVVALMSEERLSRLKADNGYPTRSIDAVLSIEGLTPSDIDVVAFAGRTGTVLSKLFKKQSLFSVKEWVRQCREFWGPVLIDKQPLTAFDDYEQSKHVRPEAELHADPYYPFVERARNADPSEYSSLFQQIRLKTLEQHLGIPAEKVRFYRHEDCHKEYGYSSAPFSGERALVIHVEGGGDDSSATVSIADAQGIREMWKSNGVQLGRLYRYVTLTLGMKPAQHEYKVMGLAPYGNAYHGTRSLEFFRTIHRVDGTEIVKTQTVPDLYISVRDALEGERFDGIAWGLQTFLEETLSTWLANLCKTHGCDTVVFSGGVAQNIKACKQLFSLPEVRRFWVGPISGDGSLGLGAAWLAHRELVHSAPQGLPGIYLGTSWDQAAIDEAITCHDLSTQFSIVEHPTPAQVAQWIADGRVVARFSGRMEFGQRALGNRSIMADPREWKSVERINQKIKYRDFWMPFTPSMLFEEVQRLIVNPKDVYSPYMTMAFDLNPAYVDALPAVIHPADKTIRPQMLKREDNPGYYDIIAAFKELSGFGVVLNTSFNLHGDAIVESPDDAINTFLKSDLDVLLFDHVAVLRNV
jgi:carbamoyltransferase